MNVHRWREFHPRRGAGMKLTSEFLAYVHLRGRTQKLMHSCGYAYMYICIFFVFIYGILFCMLGRCCPSILCVQTFVPYFFICIGISFVIRLVSMVMLHCVIVVFCGVLVFVFLLYVLVAFTCIHLWTLLLVSV